MLFLPQRHSHCSLPVHPPSINNQEVRQCPHPCIGKAIYPFVPEMCPCQSRILLIVLPASPARHRRKWKVDPLWFPSQSPLYRRLLPDSESINLLLVYSPVFVSLIVN